MTTDRTVYSVGLATADITPPVGVPLCGWSSRALHSSTGVYHPLRAVAVAVHDGETAVLLLSAEIIMFEEIAGRVRFAISQATGLSESHILLSATHTHCGPCVRQADVEAHGWIDTDYLDQAIATMAKTAYRAWKYRFPAVLRFGLGHCDFAISRRRPDPDHPGRLLFAPHPLGPTDDEVSVLTVESLDGILRGVLFSYACHPTTKDGLLIGGDYPGFAYDYLQEEFSHAQPCFLQGCGADQKARPSDPQATEFEARTWDGVRDLGRKLADAVSAVTASGFLEPVSGPLETRQSLINLCTEPLDRDLVARELSSPEDYRQRWAQYHQERLDAGLPEARSVPFEIQTLRFGDSLAVVALAAEAVVEHALRLKRDLRGRFAHVLPLGYANDVIGYLPVRRQFAELGYEVLDANQYRKRTGRFVPETEDQIHAEVARMLRVSTD